MTLRARMPEPTDEADDAVGTERIEHPFRAFFVFLVVLVAAVLLLGALAVRSSGFREMVAAKCESAFQAKPAIGGSRMVWPYDLELSRVSLPAGVKPGEPGLYLEKVRLGWRPFRGVRIDLHRPEVRLIARPDDEYEPLDLDRFGVVADAGGVMEWLEPLGRKTRLEVTDGRLAVEDGEGTVLRSLDHIFLSVRPVKIPGRKALYVRFEAGPMVSADGRYERIEQEWISPDGTGVVEMAFTCGGGDRSRHYWKGRQP